MRFPCSLLLAALAMPCAAGAQRATPRATPVRAQAARSGDSTSFVVGKRIYLRSTTTFIGTIIDTEEKHDFRGGRFARPWMKAVLVVRRDGPHEWVPVEGMAKLYVAK